MSAMPDDNSNDSPPRATSAGGVGAADDLKRQEETAAGQPATEDDEGGWYARASDKAESKLKVLFHKRKAMVYGGIVASLVGGGIFGATVLQGPFQFIQIGQLLQNHFSSGEDQSDDRFSKIARYIREPNKPENTRLSLLGNEFADRIEAKFNQRGIESSYTKLFGFLDGYHIDSSKAPETKKMTDDEVKQYYKKEYGITLEGKDGSFFASAKGMGYFQEHRLVKSIVRTSGYSGISGAIQARVMGKRAGVDWHPIRRLDNALLKSADQRYTAWRNQRNAEIENGANSVEVDTTKSTDPQKDPAAAASATAAEEQTKQVAELAKSAGEGSATDPAALAKLQSNLQLRIAGGAVAIAGIVCAVQALSANFDAVQMANVALPLMRMGMEMIAVGGQVMFGGQDLDMEQLGFYENNLYDPASKLGWADARSIQYNNGQAMSGPADPSAVRTDPNGNVFTQVLNAVPGIGSICAVEGNNIVQGGLFILSFAGGPISTVIGAGVGEVVSQYLPDIVKWLAGKPISTDVSGAAFGSYIDYGAKLASDDANASTGGVPLSQKEVGELDQIREEESQSEFQSKSLAYRLFNPRDYRTLTSRMIDKNVDPSSAVASLGNLANIFKLPGAILGQLMSKRVSARAPYDYGTPYVGTSVEDMNNPLVENPFANARVVMNTILPTHEGSDLMKRAEVCNGMIVGLDGTVKSTGTPPSIIDRSKPENKCADKSDNWLRVRFYIKDTETMESAACFEGDPEACSNVGF